MTETFTTGTTFTITDAEYIASKVAADLLGMSAYYGQPSRSEILSYYAELTILLLGNYVESVEYGFKQNDQRVLSLHYKVRTGGLQADGRSGGVYARADISGAAWFSFLIYSDRWWQLSDNERRQIEERLPVKRTYGEAPRDGKGRWVTDRGYSSQGGGTQRRSFLPE